VDEPVGDGLGITVHVRVRGQLLDVSTGPSQPDVTSAEVDVESEDASEDKGQNGHGNGQPDRQVVGGRCRGLGDRGPVVDLRIGCRCILRSTDGGMVVVMIIVV